MVYDHRMVSTGGKWKENGRAKSGGKKGTWPRNDPPFACFSGPDFGQPFYSRSFFASRRTARNPLTPPFFLWIGQQTGTKRQEKMVAIKSGGQKRVKEGHAIHARFRRGHSSLTSFYSRHDELSEIKTTCTLPPKPPSPPSLLPTNFDNKHVCTCRNISFLLNLLATGSWYTALGQELILNKRSFSLSSDTGDKLKNNVISEL